jgi:hypothetical protein
LAKVFFSYSHKDEELRDALEVHLAMLKRQGLIEALHDRRIVAGEDLGDSIDTYLEEAHVILCLLSPDFIASEYCYSREMARAMERHDADEAQVIPVVLRHCEWQETPLSKLRGTPRDNKPVKAWPDQDEALHDVAADVRRAVLACAKKPPAPLNLWAPPKMLYVPDLAAPRPRSANLQIPKSITDQDRDQFIEQAYEFVVEFIANSLDELAARNPEISSKATRLDARRLVVAVYREGRKVSAATIYMGSAWGGGRGISYNNTDSGETNSSNGSFHLPDRGDELHFKSLFGSLSGTKEVTDKEGVAEAIWSAIIAPLQRW